MIRLELPHTPPTLNTIQKRWKRGQYFGYVKKIRDEIAYLAFDARAPKATSKRHVTITRVSAGTVDQDNFSGGCKALVDALVKAGLLQDDTPAKCLIRYVQEKGKPKQQRTIIEIRDLDDEASPVTFKITVKGSPDLVQAWTEATPQGVEISEVFQVEN